MSIWTQYFRLRRFALTLQSRRHEIVEGRLLVCFWPKYVSRTLPKSTSKVQNLSFFLLPPLDFVFPEGMQLLLGSPQLLQNYSTCVCNLEQLGAGREGSAATQSAISEACQACHWIHGRHFTGEYTLKHTQREVAGECQRWERRKAKLGRESYYLCTNRQTISPPLCLSFCVSVIDSVSGWGSPGCDSPFLHGCLPIGIPLKLNHREKKRNSQLVQWCEHMQGGTDALTVCIQRNMSSSLPLCSCAQSAPLNSH